MNHLKAMNDITKRDDFTAVCTFTGHRPERLGEPEEKVIRFLEESIAKAMEEGYTDFITGMQRGVDLWAAEIVLRLKEEGKPVRHIAACPFQGVERSWPAEWQRKYHYVLKKSDEVHVISEQPGRKAFLERNEWMVDHASRLIAVYTGAPGGTYQTILYAEKKGLKLVKYPQT